MKHVVYTRCTYDTHEEVARRLRLSKRFTIPAMTEQDGCIAPRWVWLCKSQHEDMIHEAVRLAGYTGELMFNRRDKDDNIQSTLDSDDWVAPNYLSDIQSRFRKEPKTSLLYYHPWRYQVSTGMWFRPAKLASWTSMFYSIFNPSEAVRVYYRRHTQIRTTKDVRVIAVPTQGLVALVVHDTNKCTTIKRGDIEIPAPSTFIDTGRTG